MLQSDLPRHAFGEKTVCVLAYFVLTIACFGADQTAATRSSVLPFEQRGAQYLSRGPGYAVSVTSKYELLRVAGHSIGMSAVDANRGTKLDALDRMPGKASYFIGSDLRASYDL